MDNRTANIITEVKKAISGKDETIKKVLMAMLAKGHILLEDIPGVGKTTLALAFSNAIGLDYKRVQCTPDVIPSDIVGFSIYNKATGGFEFKPGAVMCNLFLADEINRTSAKTQSALLEVMQEAKVTVDGVTYQVPQPFVVIATQNPVGSAGTQMLPEAQLDRFMVRLSMGYPSFESQIEILKGRQGENPLDKIVQAISKEELLTMQEEVAKIHVSDEMFRYITILAEETRNHELIKLGVSPRGNLSLCAMAKAGAFLDGRDYVIPEDIRNIYLDVCSHRLLLNPKARMLNKTSNDILTEILDKTDLPINGR